MIIIVIVIIIIITTITRVIITHHEELGGRAFALEAADDGRQAGLLVLPVLGMYVLCMSIIHISVYMICIYIYVYIGVYIYIYIYTHSIHLCISYITAGAASPWARGA